MIKFSSQITILFSIFSFLDNSTLCSFLLYNSLDLTRHCFAFISTATWKALHFFFLFIFPQILFSILFSSCFTHCLLSLHQSICIMKTFNFSLDADFPFYILSEEFLFVSTSKYRLFSESPCTSYSAKLYTLETSLTFPLSFQHVIRYQFLYIWHLK